MQTHPTALPLLIGAALATMVQRREWVRGPWPWVALIGAAVTNLNLVVYNLLTGGRTFTYALEIRRSFVKETDESAGYVERLGNLLLGLARGLGDILDCTCALRRAQELVCERCRI